jgi:hypothetical protein
MTDWPRIRTAVDDDRPAREDEVGYCGGCGLPVVSWMLDDHAGERRCEKCRPFCSDCGDAPVEDHGDVCLECWERYND